MNDTSNIAVTVLEILAPILTVLVTIITGIVAPKIVSIVGEKNNQLLRDALHKAALNGLQFAATKAGNNASLAELTAIALQYVKELSPDTVAKIGVSDDGIRAIIASKVQEKTDINPVLPR